LLIDTIKLGGKNVLNETRKKRRKVKAWELEPRPERVDPNLPFDEDIIDGYIIHS